MRRFVKMLLIPLLSVVLLNITLSASVFGTPSHKMVVYVVNYPTKYFAERIGGDHAKVVFPAPANGDPAFWMPDAKTISDYQRADLILLNGANYARWTGKVALPGSKTVDTSKKFKDEYIIMEEVVTHSHGSEGEHAHESTAFTTWIDFALATQQARAIAKAFSRKRPELKDAFQENYAELEKDLNRLDQEIKAVVAKNPSRLLVVSHPVYHYFARRYKLNIKSMHWEPDEVPTNEQWVELHNILKSHPAKWIVWEGEPTGACVEKLKRAGVNSLVFAPCGNTPKQGDFMSVMRKNVANLRMAFQ